MQPLRESFLRGLPEPIRAAVAASNELDALLEKGIALARARHPDVDVTLHALFSRLAVHLAGTPDPLEALARVHWEDFWLATACAEGRSAAIARLERDFLVEVPQHIAHLRRDAIFEDEVRQRLRERLLVGGGTTDDARISAFSGRGPLRAWLRVTTVRLALNLLQEEKRAASFARGIDGQNGEDPLLDVASSDDLQLDHLRRRFGPLFKQAFLDALGALPLETRKLLSSHLVEGVSVEQIGSESGVHRTTIARRLADARDELFERTRTTILQTTKLSSDEFESLGAYLQTEMAQSVPRILKAETQSEEPKSEDPE